MQLIISPTSPYAWKTRIVRLEKGLSDRVEMIEANPVADGAADLVRNPLGKVPCLVREDGSLLFDSPVICAYLDSLGDAPSLFPREGERRWQADRAHALGDGVIDAAYNIVIENRRTDAEQSAFWIDRWQTAIKRSLEDMAHSLQGSATPFTIGDISYAAALGYLDFRHPDIEWRTTHPALKDWYHRIAERQSIKAAPYG